MGAQRKERKPLPKAYGIVRPRDDFGPYRYVVGGGAAYTVPGVLCPDCGEVRWLGPYYPTLEVEHLTEEVTRHLGRHGEAHREFMDLEEFQELAAKLAPHLGPNRPLMPLTHLGPTQGGAEGKFCDFNWPLAHRTIFIRRSVYELLRDAGFDIAGVPAALTYRRKRRDPLVELDVPPFARLHPSQQPASCTTCGLCKITGGCIADEAAASLTLDAASFDETVPLQRVLERVEIMLVNEALADFIRARGLDNIELTPMTFA